MVDVVCVGVWVCVCVIVCFHNHRHLWSSGTQQQIHNKSIQILSQAKTEEKAKVVAVVRGTYLNAALTI